MVKGLIPLFKNLKKGKEGVDARNHKQQNHLVAGQNSHGRLVIWSRTIKSPDLSAYSGVRSCAGPRHAAPLHPLVLSPSSSSTRLRSARYSRGRLASFKHQAYPESGQRD